MHAGLDAGPPPHAGPPNDIIAGLERASRSRFAMQARWQVHHSEKFAGKVRISLEKWPKVRNSSQK